MNNPLAKWDQQCSQKHSTGGLWKAHKMKKGVRASRTPGSTKGKCCVMQMRYQRYLAKGARSYKHPSYGNWCKLMDAINGIKR